MGKMMINHKILGYQMFRQTLTFIFGHKLKKMPPRKKCFIWYSSLVDLLANVINPEIRWLDIPNPRTATMPPGFDLKTYQSHFFGAWDFPHWVYFFHTWRILTGVCFKHGIRKRQLQTYLWFDLGKFHHDRTLFSRTLGIFRWGFGKSFSKGLNSG